MAEHKPERRTDQELEAGISVLNTSVEIDELTFQGTFQTRESIMDYLNGAMKSASLDGKLKEAIRLGLNMRLKTGIGIGMEASMNRGEPQNLPNTVHEAWERLNKSLQTQSTGISGKSELEY